jgi:energy-coupling factor transport system ATP-binding protein
MSEYPLQVYELEFQYRSASSPAISGISLEVGRGELLLVAGGSGCGKSTLLRCVNGLIPRSYKGTLRGQVLLDGQTTSALSLARIAQLVGTLLQDPEKQIVASYVAEEVAFGPENLGWPREQVRRAVDEALDELGIGHLKGRETFSLSGGEKQKVALAGLLAMRAHTLLLDEPLASLDPRAAHEALQVIRRQADRGRTVVLVEHRVEDVLGIRPERTLFMDAGRTLFLGPAEQLARHADPRKVKLPAPLALERLLHEADPPPFAAQNGQPPARLPRQPTAETLIRVEGLDFWYEAGRPVLQGVNLDIQKGDVIAVLGPNGAGKSTLVKHLIGLNRPRAGRVLVEGRDTRQVTTAQLARSVGYVFQSPTHMLFAPTVWQELAFGPQNIGVEQGQIAGRITQALQVAGLEGSEERAPLSMSFGQQKRVGIAAVLAMGSRVLLLDEPTAGQDYASYTRFMDEITAMGAFDAVLFVTHDLDLALSYANRILLVADGQIAADGRPEAVLCDDELLRRCNVLPTSLLALNRQLLPQTGRFMGLRELATQLRTMPQVVDKVE